MNTEDLFVLLGFVLAAGAVISYGLIKKKQGNKPVTSNNSSGSSTSGRSDEE